MAKYKIRDGSVMTDADFERLSKQASRGDYPGVPGEWVVRPQSRPRLDGDPTRRNGREGGGCWGDRERVDA